MGIILVVTIKSWSQFEKIETDGYIFVRLWIKIGRVCGQTNYTKQRIVQQGSFFRQLQNQVLDKTTFEVRRKELRKGKFQREEENKVRKYIMSWSKPFISIF